MLRVTGELEQGDTFDAAHLDGAPDCCMVFERHERFRFDDVSHEPVTVREVTHHETARRLVGMFQKNFTKYEQTVDAEVRAAAPEVRLAAE